MSKLLVNAPSGAQELVDVGPGGGYFDLARVLWDERADGPLPEGVTLGGMVRVGGALVLDADLQAASAAAAQAAAEAALIAVVTVATQQRLDAFAQTRNYDGILSACTYAASTVPTFQAEGQYCVAARDATWSALYQIMAEVQGGTRPMPAGYADIEPDLPALEWPA